MQTSEETQPLEALEKPTQILAELEGGQPSSVLSGKNTCHIPKTAPQRLLAWWLGSPSEAG